MKNNWSTKKLREVANVYGGGTAPTNTPEYYQGDFNWYSPYEIPSENIISLANSQKQISEAAKKFTTIIQPHSVLLSSRATIGNIGITSTASGYSQGIKGLTPVDDQEIDSWFLAYWLKANKQTLINNAGGTTFKEISTSAIKNLDIKVPSKNIQQKIVVRLNAIRKAQELCDTQISKTEEFFAAALFSEINRFHERNDDELDKYCELITDGIHNTPKLANKGIPMLDSKDIEDLVIHSDSATKFISEQTNKILSKRCKPKNGDILLSSRGSIGKLALVGNQNFNIMGNIILIRVNKSKLEEKYLLYYLVINRAKLLGLATGSSQKGLYLNTVRNFKVKIPKIKNQIKIVEKLDAIQEYKKLLLKQKSLLKELFDSVLYKSMNGEMD